VVSVAEFEQELKFEKLEPGADDGEKAAAQLL